ncbi:AbrB family transcriptional regulator [Sphingomonas sp.]|jgi:antitoxin VapB|uniref:antitoxin n=1 Tax=Sphingomonas sp. TaxID=28214 RepID=UPI002EDAC647
MGRQYRTRTFKSGNSVAIRLPSGLGLAAGMEFELFKDDEGVVHAKPVGIPGATLRDLFGSFSADFMADGRMPADEPDRDWGDAPSRAA